jgi:inhibitor of cysteine peptidase
VALSSGSDHTLALKSDGTVVAWGDNSDGQLGDGTTTARRLSPVAVPGLAAVSAVSASVGNTSFALKSDGTVMAWGKNDYGQLGDGSTAQRNSPVEVTGLALKSGYCDGNGVTTISDVQSAINMFLGMMPLTACVDLDGNNVVSISEVQTVINAFLGLSSGSFTYSISGTVTSGGIALAGVAVGTTGASATTDASGNYTLSGLANGSFTVIPTKTDYTFTPANLAVTVNGANVTGKNFTTTPATYSISGTVTSGGIALAGVTVSTSGVSAITDATGKYTIPGLVNGDYTITATKAGYDFPLGVSVTVNGSNVALTTTIIGSQAPAPMVAPTLSLSASTLSFTDQIYRSASPVTNVTLTNTSAATAYIDRWTPSGDGVTGAYPVFTGGDFLSTNNCGPSLDAGKSCTVGITFRPSATGKRVGTLAITSYANPLYITSGGPSTVTTLTMAGTGIDMPYTLTGTWAGTWQLSWTKLSSTGQCTQHYNDGGALSISLTQNGRIDGIAIPGNVTGNTLSADGVQGRSNTTCALVETYQYTGGSISADAGGSTSFYNTDGVYLTNKGAIYFTNFGIGSLSNITASGQWDGDTLYGTMNKSNSDGTASNSVGTFSLSRVKP